MSDADEQDLCIECGRPARPRRKYCAAHLKRLERKKPLDEPPLRPYGQSRWQLVKAAARALADADGFDAEELRRAEDRLRKAIERWVASSLR